MDRLAAKSPLAANAVPKVLAVAAKAPVSKLIVHDSLALAAYKTPANGSLANASTRDTPIGPTSTDVLPPFYRQQV